MNDQIRPACPPPWEKWRHLAGWLKLARAVREFEPEEKIPKKIRRLAESC